jgi:hypothetical protein
MGPVGWPCSSPEPLWVALVTVVVDVLIFRIVNALGVLSSCKDVWSIPIQVSNGPGHALRFDGPASAFDGVMSSGPPRPGGRQRLVPTTPGIAVSCLILGAVIPAVCFLRPASVGAGWRHRYKHIPTSSPRRSTEE